MIFLEEGRWIPNPDNSMDPLPIPKGSGNEHRNGRPGVCEHSIFRSEHSIFRSAARHYDDINVGGSGPYVTYVMTAKSSNKQVLGTLSLSPHD